MKIQLNTDNNITGTENLEAFVNDEITRSLKHFTQHITRVEVYFTDQNGDKGGPDDIQCKLEARVEGKQPVIVSSKNASKEKAFNDALDKMKATLATLVGKMKGK